MSETRNDPLPPVAYSIKDFCKSHCLGVSTYYELRKKGLGPREKRINSHIIITQEAAAEWRAGNDKLITKHLAPRWWSKL